MAYVSYILYLIVCGNQVTFQLVEFDLNTQVFSRQVVFKFRNVKQQIFSPSNPSMAKLRKKFLREDSSYDNKLESGQTWIPVLAICPQNIVNKYKNGQNFKIKATCAYLNRVEWCNENTSTFIFNSIFCLGVYWF